MIVNAVNYGGEVDMLLGHLHHHAEHVDRFAITECDRTYTGLPKGLSYLDNLSLFADFKDKISYHPTGHLNESNAWANEYDQRRYMNNLLASLELQDDDVVFYLDTDEWLDFRTLKMPDSPQALDMQKFLFSVHWYQKNELTGFGATYRHIKHSDINSMRWNRNGYPSQRNGWHWTSMGTLEYHLTKLRSFSHTELLTENWQERATHSWQHGIDFLTGEHYQEIDLQPDYPSWILNHQAPKTWYRKRSDAVL